MFAEAAKHSHTALTDGNLGVSSHGGPGRLLRSTFYADEEDHLSDKRLASTHCRSMTGIMLFASTTSFAFPPSNM
jgi:hypothetical protein